MNSTLSGIVLLIFLGVTVGLGYLGWKVRVGPVPFAGGN